MCNLSAFSQIISSVSFLEILFYVTLIFTKCTVSVLGYVVITYVLVVTLYILHVTAVYIEVAHNLWLLKVVCLHTAAVT